MNASPEQHMPEDHTGRMVSGLTEFSLRRQITLLVLLMSTVVVGIVATVGIPVELFPRGFTSQGLFVWVPWQNAPTQEVLDKITLPKSAPSGASTASIRSPPSAAHAFSFGSNKARTWTWPTARCATVFSAPGCISRTTWTAFSFASTTPPGFPSA